MAEALNAEGTNTEFHQVSVGKQPTSKAPSSHTPTGEADDPSQPPPLQVRQPQTPTFTNAPNYCSFGCFCIEVVLYVHVPLACALTFTMLESTNTRFPDQSFVLTLIKPASHLGTPNATFKAPLVC